MFKKISIVGVGLIGGSIGIAAKKRKLAKQIVGIGRRKSSIRKAIAKGSMHRGTLTLEKGVADADLIIIATPADKVIKKIKEALRYAKKGAIIIDVNSTKEAVVDYADRATPKGIYFVGTHPMAGLEKSGVLFADAELFKDTVCVITPTRYTNKKALSKVRAFWSGLGASIKILTPARHDKIVAGISHLPHLLSYNLCNTVLQEELSVAGTGFKDTTRIAKSEPKMWINIFLQNKAHVLDSIKRFEHELSSLKSCIRRNAKASLLKKIKAAQIKRKSIG